MKQYHRFGHCDQIFVSEGDTVKKGDKIATIGTGNGQWSGHLHYDCPKEKLSSWTAYVFGRTKDEVAKVYADPAPYRELVLPSFDHFGWEYLEYATYTSGNCYHPGEDLNGAGAGNADVGDPIYSPCDGVVKYVYDGSGSNSGWGKLLVIKETLEEKETEEESQEVTTPEETENDESTQEPVSVENQETVQEDETEEETPDNSIPEGSDDSDGVSDEESTTFLNKLVNFIINLIKKIWSK